VVTNISKKSAIRKHVNTKDHNDAKKLEKARIQMESLQNQIFSSNVNENHNTGFLFLAKHNLPLKLLTSTIKLIKESGSPNLFSGSITYTNQNSGNEFLEAIYNIIEKEIWKELSDVIAFGIMIDESTDITITKHLDIYVLCVTFASDDASVMLGKKEDVAVKLFRVCSYPLIVNHCVAYRLALT
ncbi:3261_t:CDS:2, partial [Funneliformis geosporum]